MEKITHPTGNKVVRLPHIFGDEGLLLKLSGTGGRIELYQYYEKTKSSQFLQSIDIKELQEAIQFLSSIS